MPPSIPADLSRAFLDALKDHADVARAQAQAMGSVAASMQDIHAALTELKQAVAGVKEGQHTTVVAAFDKCLAGVEEKVSQLGGVVGVLTSSVSSELAQCPLKAVTILKVQEYFASLPTRQEISTLKGVEEPKLKQAIRDSVNQSILGIFKLKMVWCAIVLFAVSTLFLVGAKVIDIFGFKISASPPTVQVPAKTSP